MKTEEDEGMSEEAFAVRTYRIICIRSAIGIVREIVTRSRSSMMMRIGHFLLFFLDFRSIRFRFKPAF